jgi:hypothetical protein
MSLFCLVLLLLTVPAAWAQAQSKTQQITDNPQRDVLSRAEEPDRGLVEFDCSHCSAMTDLLFVAATEDCGNAGCNFYVFKKTQGKSYQYLTKIFLNHNGFQFLKTRHHGLNDILFYAHDSAAQGTLVRYEYDGKNYEERESEVISSSDFSSRITTPEPVVQVYLSKDLQRVR